jgi:pyrroline-5-carboxylate reductase
MLSDMRLGFIGAGNMATALIRGLLEAELVVPEQILVSDIDAEKTAELVSAYKVTACPGNRALVKDADVVILAVKPRDMARVTAEISSEVREGQTFISIAAGVPIERLANGLGPEARILRVMPNTPAVIGAGAAGIAPGPRATDNDIAITRAIFEAVGIVVVVEEKDLDAVTAVSGSGPAYVFYFTEAFIAAAIEAGLDEATAVTLVKATVLGAAEMMSELDQPPSTLRQAVTSPGGTTQAALAVLQDGGLDDLVKRAVAAAKNRSSELGKI